MDVFGLSSFIYNVNQVQCILDTNLLIVDRSFRLKTNLNWMMVNYHCY